MQLENQNHLKQAFYELLMMIRNSAASETANSANPSRIKALFNHLSKLASISIKCFTKISMRQEKAMEIISKQQECQSKASSTIENDPKESSLSDDEKVVGTDSGFSTPSK
mmetsp:Transcript_11600/g.13172  ORF Transcript_11600/g.13172 Transcript_11600/m.13172 type:complete len:111 (+) Transcript_11600:319-651(+)